MDKEQLMDQFIEQNLDVMTSKNISENRTELKNRFSKFMEDNNLKDDKYFNKVLEIFSVQKEDIKPYEIKRKEDTKGRRK